MEPNQPRYINISMTPHHHQPPPYLNTMQHLRKAYPWLKAKSPLLANAPMLNISLPNLATTISSSGGFGFLAAGYDVTNLTQNLEQTTHLVTQSNNTTLQSYHKQSGLLPIGIGFLNWGAHLDTSLDAIARYKPAAVWFFAPTSQPDDLRSWTERVRAVTGNKTSIWIQIGTVAEATAVVQSLNPDVLIVQGCDAGGHGLARSASIVSLVPEAKDALHRLGKGDIPILAAGGIVDGRGVAASIALGAVGAVMGTRFLASHEANVARGYRDRVLDVDDGGVSTVRTTVYDRVRGIHGWPERYNGRGIVNRSYVDAVEGGMDDEENRRLYAEELKVGDRGWNADGRLTTYAGTGVGLVREALPAADIVDGVLREARDVLSSCSSE